MCLFLFSSGVLSSAFWPLLPCVPLIVAMAVAAIPLCVNPHFRPVFCLLLGIAWASIWGHHAIDQRLPESLDKTDYVVTGVIRDIPQGDRLRTTFYLDVHSLQALHGEQSQPKLKRLRLAWYQGPTLEPGQTWQLQVRLRTPRGLSNPGGFDYTGWLLTEGVSATGYVRSTASNKLLSSAEGVTIASFRFTLQRAIAQLALSEHARGFISALTIGDKKSIPSSMWRTLQVTGTIHLMVVSGLHIGMIASVGWLIGIGLGRIMCAFGASIPAPQIGAGVALSVALGYSLLAGFSLPTQRAVIMLSVFLSGPLLRRKIAPGTGLLWSLALVSLCSPLAALSAGFWLSFTAVAGLVWYFNPRSSVTGWRRLLLAQVVVFFSLAGWLLLFQGEINLVAPLVNILAIPWVSISVVPLCLLGGVLLPISTVAADACWMLAGYQLDWFASGLEFIAGMTNGARFTAVGGARWLTVTVFVCAGGLLLLPRGIGWHAPAVVLLLASIWLKPVARAPLTVTALDVGQGLAVVIETPQGVLLYDTGPKFGESFDAGSGIIAPFLRSRGIGSVDLLVVSHNDTDHSGGASGLSRYYQPVQTVAGSPDKLLATYSATRCENGQHWQWNGVSIDVLHPDSANAANDNNQSCVVLIRYKAISVLLTGDIEAAVEAKLIQQKLWPSNVTLLIAPHHGSKTSSSARFVRVVQPQHVIFSAGYRHHFGHPHPDVVERYREFGATLWSTAISGALRFSWDRREQLLVHEQRDAAHRYWH